MDQRPKYSKEFKERIGELLSRHGLTTVKAAEMFVDGEISRESFRQWREDGKVPTYDTLLVLEKCFPDTDLVADLVRIAGYPDEAEMMLARKRGVDLPPGVYPIGQGSPLPGGLTASATELTDIGEPFQGEMLSLDEEAKRVGGTHWLTVQGRCLEPDINQRDRVIVRRDGDFQEGDIVLVRHGNEYCLKRLEQRDGAWWFGTNDEKAFPGFPASEDTAIWGVVLPDFLVRRIKRR